MKHARAHVGFAVLSLVTFLGGCGNPPPVSTPSAPLPSAPFSAAPHSTVAPSPEAPTRSIGSPAAPAMKPAATKPAAARVAPKAGEPCTGGQLRAELKVAGRAGDGPVMAAVGLRNKSGNPCTMDGFPGLQLLAAGADPISTSPVETGSKARITVAAGATAWARLSWKAGDAACGPRPAQLAIFAPDDTVEMDVAFTTGPVCDGGQISVGALQSRSPL